MKRLIVAAIIGGIVFGGSLAFGQGLRNSPYSLRNSPYSMDNSPYSMKNSPYNMKNSPHNLNSDRVLRDNQGRAWGYAVPKRGGGVNVFDYDGNRLGYTP